MMMRFIIVVLIVLAFCGMVSCAASLDYKMCQAKGKQLGAEARLIGNRCIVKGWGVVM